METPAGQTDFSYGLKQGVLSGNETLAQSIALIAPTAGPLLTIPLVFATAGTGTWLTFVFSTLMIFLVALSVNQFARISASPGSLYSYISAHLHPILGMLAAWALLIAYIGTAIAIAAGLTNYTLVVFKSTLGITLFPLAVAVAGIGLAVWLAYRDVTMSARLMLGLEVVSVVLISVVSIGVLARHGFHPDMEQLTLKGATPDKLRLGLVLAVFCFVGFESATSLGWEAKDPLKNIPRAVKWSGILAGLFFIFCAYSEVLGFRGEPETLDKSLAPMNVLARNAGLASVLGLLINLGALVSFFSCLLACITASARVIYRMGQRGVLLSSLGQAHASNQTPHRAIAVSGLAVLLPLGVMTWTGMSPFDVYGLLGTLATFGFLTAYLLVSIAAPIFLHKESKLQLSDVMISVLAVAAMTLALVGNIYPVPPAPYTYLPYIYLVLLVLGLSWSLVMNARSSSTSALSDRNHTGSAAVAE
jgi:amino acid transporter